MSLISLRKIQNTEDKAGIRQALVVAVFTIVKNIRVYTSTSPSMLGHVLKTTPRSDRVLYKIQYLSS